MISFWLEVRWATRRLRPVPVNTAMRAARLPRASRVRRRPSFFLFAIALLLAVPSRADVACAAIFGDHMVLQRGRPVPIWGTANAGERVSVEFAGQSVAAMAGADGRWRVALAAMAASAEPHTLTVRATNTVTFTDVLVGEVWLCSGQSNMEKQLGPRRGQKPTDNYEEEIRQANRPLLRLYQMPQHGRPQQDVRGLEWVACSPETVASTQFSAAGYYFGREILRELKVPIGVIHSSFGGTQIEAWIPEAAFAAHPAISDLRHVEYQAWVKGVQATELYGSMIAPIVPYALRGFLWYQGESNCMQADGAIYTEKMRALIDGWRTAWGDEAAPWYFVQLAPFDYSRWTSFPKQLTSEALPLFWEAQTEALEIPHTGMVVTTDLVTNVHDIHPTNKRSVGLRLARLALAQTYGLDLATQGPRYEAMESLGAGRIALRFANVGGDLKTRDGKPPTDFAIAGSDSRFVPATAWLEGERVVVTSPEVAEPVAVRFAWNETATPNLVNSSGLPAVPFRTDRWPVNTERPRPPAAATGADLEKAFVHPPAEARPWVFWYWMNAAVSRAGIATDLAAMKQAGVAGAYIFPIRGPAQPPLITPPVEQLTAAWWDHVRYAFEEADRLGLKLALHDCDGFATAGGPWITPELSMQRVVWSDVTTPGGKTIDLALPQPVANEGYYRDLAVFAVAEHDDVIAGSGNHPTVTASVAGASPQFLADPASKEVFRSEGPCWIQYAYPEPFTCRAITIRLPPAPNAYQPNTYQANRLAVEVSDDGTRFRRVARLVPPRHGWQDGDADVTHAIAPVTARFFRFVNDPADAEPGAEDLDSAKWKPVLKVRAIGLSSRPTVHGFEGKSGAVWRVMPGTDETQLPADLALPKARVIDVSSHLGADGRFVWQAPAGNWRIMRFGHTSTGHRNETGGAAKGLECDKFNPAAVRLQFDHWFAEAMRQMGPDLARRVLKIFHVDSWECGSQNWSPVFRAEFTRRRGYDPLPYLPAMAGVPVESADVAERFLRDVRVTIAELVADNFYGTLAQLAHGLGCEFSAESVAPTMVSDGMAHFSHVDVPMGEFWLRSPTNDKLGDVLDAVSGARAYGRPIVQAESFTERTMQWDETPCLVKALQDRNYTFGINRVVYHVFAHNPWPERRPGMTLSGVGLFFQPNQTWWRHAGAWVDYTARAQAVLQLGRPVADVLVFTGEEIPARAVVPWHLATTLPRFVKPLSEAMAGRKSPRIVEPADWIDPLHGYAYDSVNRDALLRLAKVRDGRIELPGGGTYSVLIVPAENPVQPIADALTPEVAAKLREFAEGGVTVILGERPTRSPRLEGYPGADGKVAAAIDVLWPTTVRPGNDARTLGQGKVVAGPYVGRSFDALGIAPDAQFLDPQSREAVDGIAWTHRAGKGWDAYFVSNQDDAARSVLASLRVTGRRPELWDAVTGIRQDARAWRVVKDRTEVDVSLAAQASVFVVFRTAATEAPAPSPAAAANIAPIALSGPWQVSFDPANGGPSAALAFAELVSWTARPEPEVRNYSGTAVYRRTIEWKPAGVSGTRVWLNLGTVHDLAAVSVNGQRCGVAWTAPYRVDLGGALREGANTLEIEVTNTWHNRLLADRDLPEEKRVTWTTAPALRGNRPLLDAGLIGPVRLESEP